MPGRPGRSGGRNRKTAEQHVAEGTFQPVRHGKRPRADEQPSASGASATVPTAPSFLGGHALREWRRIVRELARKELLELVDRAALTAYCLAWQELRDAEAAIAAHLAGWKAIASDPNAAFAEAVRRCSGTTTSNTVIAAVAEGVQREAAEMIAGAGRIGRNRHGELVAHPAVRIAAAAEKRVREFSIEFFLTPLARNRQAQKPAGAGNPHGSAAEREAAARRQERRQLAAKLGIGAAS